MDPSRVALPVRVQDAIPDEQILHNCQIQVENACHQNNIQDITLKAQNLLSRYFETDGIVQCS